jgi:hypothetical protein
MSQELACLRCRNCGDVVDPRRVALGYDYCLKEECQQRCLERVHLAAVGVNKAADYYMKAEEVLPPRPAVTTTAPPPQEVEADGPNEDGPNAYGPNAYGPNAYGRTRPAPAARTEKRAKTTIERLRELEAALDRALDRGYERFRRGEITATEMHRERDQLVGAFNRVVMAQNIRYRSMLRGPVNRAG